MNPIPCLTLRVLRPRDTLKRYSIHRHTMRNNITLRIKEHFVPFSELYLNINTGKQVYLHFLYECPTVLVVHSTYVIIKVFFSRGTFLY